MAFERDKELLNHAFSISEQEYQDLYENLNKEYDLKSKSIEKLKIAIKDIENENANSFNYEEDNLLSFVDYVNSQIHRRKTSEENLKRTLNLFTTLLSNLHSGILVEDETRRILYTNQLFCDMFSIDANPTELTGIDCSNSAEDVKGMFMNSESFVSRIKIILEDKTPVFGDVLYLNDARIFERNYIPIFIDNEHKGHLWEYKDITEKQNSELKLIELTKVQEAILNGTDYSIIYTDTNGLIKSFNKGAEKMLGYKAEEVVDKQTPQLFHKATEIIVKAKKLSTELGVKVKAGFDVFVLKSKSHGIDTNEWTYITKEGKELIVSLSVSTLTNVENEIIGFLGIARDITQQKQVQQALQESEERYRSIVEKSTDIIYKTDQQGCFTFVNQVAERITGYSKAELTSMHFSTLIREDYRNQAFEVYKNQLHERKNSSYFEFPIITKSGEEKWIRQNVQLEELEPERIEFTALAIDVTERKNYERTILLQKEKYQNIIDNMNLGLLEVDLEDRIQYSNPAFTKISGYEANEVIGKIASNLLILDSQKSIIQGKKQKRLAGEADSYEILVTNKRGEKKWWMISGAPNYNDKGELIGSIGIHLDITEAKQLELELEGAKQKAEQSSKAKEAFLANMSHEIRTPLNAIIGMIRELKKDKLSEQQNYYAENASIASQHLLSVLNNILDISKIEAGELQLETVDFELKTILNDVRAIMITKCLDKNLFFQINHSDTTSDCFIGDASRIRQILINLVGNAVKFTEKGGILINYTIENSNNNNAVLTITIVDTGIGMDASFVDNLFNKFSQEDSSISRKYGGSGLGMAITKELVQLMNGQIEVESEKGKGTTFRLTMTLPKGNKENIIEVAEVSSTNKVIRVLLVEDNEFNRIVAKNTLKHYNCNTTEATTGKEAISILSKNQNFDVILMDLQMPIMDGFEATKYIREKLHLTIPIIALTANAFKSELEQCKKIGMDDFVTKPFEEKTLMEVIYKVTNDKTVFQEDNEIVRNQDTKRYDLTYLRQTFRDDESQIKRMIEIFIQQVNEAIEGIQTEYLANNLEKVSEIAHKIKPSIDNMGITELRNVTRFIEKTAKEKMKTQELDEQINQLIETLQVIVIELTKEQ